MGVDLEGGFWRFDFTRDLERIVLQSRSGMLVVVVVVATGVFGFESGSGGRFGSGRAEQSRRFVEDRGLGAAFCSACGRQQQQLRGREYREDDERGGGIHQWHGDGSALRSSGEEQQGGFGVRHPGRRVLA